ncbi:hypothetical protein ABEF93_000786 [Exophiala dermatitidis]
MASNEHNNGRIVYSPYAPPSHPEKSQLCPPSEHIHIKHPGSDSTLFTLPRLDSGGIHHETVRTACAILDDNRWDGFLTLDKHGEHPVPKAETILRAKIYYFHTSWPLNDLDYAVTPTFEHWRFPHDNLPPSWRDIASFKQTSRPESDNYCRITQFEDGVEVAHLVPSAERQWFNNNMTVYIDSTRADKLKDSDNSIRLRSDVHSVFDAKRFAIVPIDGRLVVYCMNTKLGSQVERLYHGVELHRIRDSGYLGHFLLARFAYTVFERLRAWLESNTSRKLRLRVDNATRVEICSPERCWRFAQYTAYQGKSRSVSPKKRPHPDAGAAVDSDDECQWVEAEFRGRKRRRDDPEVTQRRKR